MCNKLMIMENLFALMDSLDNMSDKLQTLFETGSIKQLSDGKTVIENDNFKLELDEKDNVMSIVLESKEQLYKEEFQDYCDTLDDEFFTKVCEVYENVYGEGSLSELDKEVTLEGMKSFKEIVKDVALVEIEKLTKYYDGTKTNNN